MSQKSLFAYFKSPKPTGDLSSSEASSDKKKLDKTVKTPSPSSSHKKASKRQSKISPSSKENQQPKRRRRVIESESEDDQKSGDDALSSGDEFKPAENMDTLSEDSESEGDMEGEEQPKKGKSANKKRPSEKSVGAPSQFSTPKLSKFKASEGRDATTPPSRLSTASSPSTSTLSVGHKTLNKLSSFSAPSTEAGDPDGPKYHQNLEFLKPDKIKDKNGRLQNDENYDRRTVFLPPNFLDSVTPAMRQWWVLKADHFDTVLFFKMGKFYEFFHMDADVGVKELGLIYMKGGNHAHAGFPEIAYGRYADSLLRKGYKIARIEQTETPDMMSDRLDQSTKKATKFDKVVKREVCQIATPGTRTPNFMDGETIDVSSNYLLAVCEKPGDRTSHIGVCFLDTSIGKIYLGQFEDDIYGSRLRTLVAHYIPGQILFEKKSRAPLIENLCKTTLSSVMKEALVPGKEFWDSDSTVKFLSEAEYFRTGESAESLDWPEVVKSMLADGDSVSRKAADGYDLALSSLGAVIWYLRFCFLDQEILSLKSFTEYVPLDNQPKKDDSETSLVFENTRMVLDSVTLANLDILTNQTTGTTEGSLIERLDRCKTAGGKRLLREWISAPLCGHKLINDRLEAITNLMAMGDLSLIQSDIMRKLPDFERLLSRIHTLGHARRSQSHPDSRAIMFESEAYSKRKIDSFLSIIDGFRTALRVVDAFHEVEITSNVLKKCVTFKQDGGHLADVRPLLKYFEESFDHEAARKAGAIHPAKGYVEEYDESVVEIKEIKDKLSSYLKAQSKLLSSQQVQYIGTGRNRYQLEVPEAACKRVPSHYEVSGQRKGFKRYVTEETKCLLAELMEAEDKQVLALRDTMRRIFSKFDESYERWMDVVQCMNVLDVLLSLTSYTMMNEGIMCRPEIVAPGTTQQPFVEIRDGRHPSAVKTFRGSDFIPNDTVIGWHNADTDHENSQAELLLLTGPNMGGKSTLMRQVGLLTIMSQLGCYVPAERCRLTPVDRMFTRLGASDRIMHGESTFFVELSETSIILQHATRHSLVLLDELGRGTATHDGTAIASAVVNELAENVKCRTIFSTHYHSLVDDFKHNPHIQLGHMACMVGDGSEEIKHTGEETITFLYKLVADFCPKSYGFNVARLAGLPSKVIELGLAKAQELERITESRRFIRSIMLAKKEKRVDEIPVLIKAAS